MKYGTKISLLVMSLSYFLSACGREEVPTSKAVENAQVPPPATAETISYPKPETKKHEVSEPNTIATPQPVAEDLVPPAEPTFSVAEVALHNNKADCWIIIGDSVYDITNFFETHPGGEAPVRFCGRDATAVFSRIHDGSAGADFMAQQYRIGQLIR
jgi:cytochrome b involved in lipid metabolism